MQLEAISKKRQKYIEELDELLDLEEKLQEAQWVYIHKSQTAEFED